MTGMGTGKLENIQALRAIAALGVLCAHLSALKVVYPSIVFPAIPGAAAGVDLFFVISGFIIAHVTVRSWGHRFHFLRARALRIYPMYWIVCAAAGTFGLVTRGDFSMIRSLLLIPTLDARGEIYPPLIQAWTLVYEMLFYVTAAGLMFAPRRHFASLLFATCCTSYAASFVLPAGALCSYLGNPVYFEFWIGVVLQQAFAAKHAPRHRFLVWGSLAAAIASYLAPWDEPHMRLFAWGMPAAAVVAWALWLQHSARLAPRWLVALGDASYSMYLAHSEIIRWVAPALITLSFLPLQGVVVGAVVIGVSVVLFVTIEKPMHDLARMIVGARPTTNSPAPA
jgi:exopolysaccharide production protein ExoZ